MSFQLSAKLPANRSEQARASSQRVRLITHVGLLECGKNTGEDSAESYLWSHFQIRDFSGQQRLLMEGASHPQCLKSDRNDT